MKKHSNKYRIYEIEQDLINFLRGDGEYQNRPNTALDKQVYTHYNQRREHSDKYIGIIIELENKIYFAPLSHDGDGVWSHRDDTCDFEKIYDSFNKYAGSLLLCKALPLTGNLVKYLSFREIEQKEDTKYADLCRDELEYLNSIEVHPRLQDKMQKCIYGHQTSCMQFRIDYQLAVKNVAEYNQLKQSAK